MLYEVITASKIKISPDASGVDEKAAAAQMDALEKDAPCVFSALLPILLPIVLIVLNSIAKYPSHPFGEGGQALTLLNFFGQPVVALLIGVALAMLLPKNFSYNFV